MIIKTKNANVSTVDRIVAVLKEAGFVDIQIMRTKDKKFVIAVLGAGADNIDIHVLKRIYNVTFEDNNDFFLSHYASFEEAWKFFEDFDNQKKAINA
jgi:hypothetical protein